MNKINHNITAIVQVYNEAPILERWINSVNRFCSSIVAYNDGSTDESLSFLQKKIPESHIINSPINQHHLESHHHQKMFNLVKEVAPDTEFIWCSATDEMLPDYPDLIPDINSILDKVKSINAGYVKMNNAELWLSDHWYRVDSEFSQVPYTRFYKFDKDKQWFDKELSTNPHCRTQPQYIYKMNAVPVLPPEYGEKGLMTLHYGYTSKERIIRRYIKMAEQFSTNNFDPQWIWFNWIRGVDIRKVELLHLPAEWAGGCKSCKQPFMEEEETLIPKGKYFIQVDGKDKDVYDYWVDFRDRKYLERLY